MISKDRLSFDPTDAGSIASSDSMGAFLRSSDGTLIDHTDVSGDKALNVYFLNSSFPISATDLDIRNLSHTQDSVKVGDGTDFLAIATDGSIAVTDNGSSLTVDATNLDIRDLAAATDSVSAWMKDGAGNAITSTTGFLDVNLTNASVAVTATDLDIRNLAHTQDSVKVGDGTDFLAIATDGSIAVTDNGSSLTVDATNLDIRDLAAASDSVAAWMKDGSGTSITSTGGALDVNIASGIEVNVEDDKANTALKTTAKTSTGTQSALLGSSLANRRFLFIQNLGNKHVYLAEAGATDAAVTGIQLSPGSVAEFRFGAALIPDVKSSSGSQNLRVLEAS